MTKFTKTKIIFSVIMLFDLLGATNSSLAAVIFEDNFDNWPQVNGGDWHCCNATDCLLNNASRNQSPAPWNIYAWYCNALSPGGWANDATKIVQGRSGKGIGFCAKQGITGNYFTGLKTSNSYSYQKIYVRMYLNFSSGIQKAVPGKYWKFLDRHYMANSGEPVYIEGFAIDEDPSLRTIQRSRIGFVAHLNYGEDNSPVYLSSFIDKWEYLEYMIDMPNHTLKLWYGPYNTENNPAFTATNVDFGTAEGSSMINFTLGFGNTDASTNFTNTNWACMSADDYVASTTFVGPVGGGGDTIAPSAPSGLSVQ